MSGNCAARKAIAPVTSLQPRYSLVHREIEDQVLPYCLQEGIGVIVYSPMASGLLTGAMTRERAAKLPADDWRKTHPDFTEPIFQAIWRWLNACSRLPGATTGLREKSQSHGHYTILPSPERSSVPAMHVRQRESCAPVTCASPMRK